MSLGWELRVLQRVSTCVLFLHRSQRSMQFLLTRWPKFTKEAKKGEAHAAETQLTELTTLWGWNQRRRDGQKLNGVFRVMFLLVCNNLTMRIVELLYFPWTQNLLCPFQVTSSPDILLLSAVLDNNIAPGGHSRLSHAWVGGGQGCVCTF